MRSGKIHLVEDDEPLRLSLERLLTASGHQVMGYASAQAILHAIQSHPDMDDGNTAVIMDVHLGADNGIEVQRLVRSWGSRLPFVFISAHQDAKDVNQAWRDGAINFLFKPFSPEDLLKAIDAALQAKHPALPESQPTRIDPDILKQFKRLTPRQKEVMKRVAHGKSNAEISMELSISPRTVKMHRASIMHGLGFHHVADLIRFHDACRELF